MILELCKGVHCVDLSESFQTHIYLQNLASIQPRTSPVKFARSHHGGHREGGEGAAVGGVGDGRHGGPSGAPRRLDAPRSLAAELHQRPKQIKSMRRSVSNRKCKLS